MLFSSARPKQTKVISLSMAKVMAVESVAFRCLRECIEIDPALAGLDRLYVLDVVEKMIEMHSDVLSRFDEDEE